MTATEARKAKEAPAFSHAETTRILELVKGSNSVELKLSVPTPGHRATIASIGLDPVEAQPRQTFFFDTPDLALNKVGLIVRARRIQGGAADTVIKLRPVDPATIDPELRRSDSFKVELDVMPGKFVCSASVKGSCSGQDVLDVTAGAATIRSLFSKEQRAFYDEHAPAGVAMDSLSTLGPIFVLKAKHRPKDYDQRIVVELWLYPDGSRILEISTKSPPADAFLVAAQFRTWLAGKGLKLSGNQTTKTSSALEIMSAGLKSARPVRRPARKRAAKAV